MIDASELYAELLLLTHSQREAKLANLAVTNARLAADLAAMLTLEPSTTIANNDLSEYVSGYDPDSALIGEKVMGFDITELLSNRGGMGRVFKAQQTLSNQTQHTHHYAAIKVLRSDVIASEDIKQYFYREAASLIELSHPNICQVYGVADVSEHACIVMELINGVTLDQFLSNHNLDFKERWALCLQMLQAMSYAHQKHIYHADLKPQNIMVNAEGQLKLIDLGLAKGVDDRTLRNNEHGYIQGFSALWSSPEQQQGRWHYSQSDVYSLGLLVKLLLAAETDGQSLKGRELSWIIAKASHEQPQQRYSQADELLKDLISWHQNKALPHYRHDISYRTIKQLQQKPWQSITLITVLLTLIGVTVITTYHNQQLQKKQRSNNQVIQQFERTMSANVPALSYMFQSLTVAQMYLRAANDWQQTHKELDNDASQQIAINLIKGLLQTQQTTKALTLLDIIKPMMYENDEHRYLWDKWFLNAAGISTANETPNIHDASQYITKRLENPLLFPKNQLGSELAQQYLEALDKEEEANKLALSPVKLQAYAFALGVAMPYKQTIRQQRIDKLRQHVSALIESPKWSKLTPSQQLELMIVIYPDYPVSMILTMNVLASPPISSVKTVFKTAVAHLLAQKETLTLSQQYYLGLIGGHLFALDDASPYIALINQVTNQPELTISPDFAPVLLAQETLEGDNYTQQLANWQKQTDQFKHQYVSHSAVLHYGINVHAQQAIELGQLKRAQQLIDSVNTAHYQHNTEHNLSGSLTAELALAIIQRDKLRIASISEQLYQFQQQHNAEFSRYYNDSEFVSFQFAEALAWYWLVNDNEPQANSMLQKSYSYNVEHHLAYMWLVLGQHQRALESVIDSWRLKGFGLSLPDGLYPLHIDIDKYIELAFLYGRKVDSPKGYQLLQQLEEAYGLTPNADNIYSVKLSLYQTGLLLRAYGCPTSGSPHQQEVEQAFSWLNQADLHNALSNKHHQYLNALNALQQECAINEK